MQRPLREAMQKRFRYTRGSPQPATHKHATCRLPGLAASQAGVTARRLAERIFVPGRTRWARCRRCLCETTKEGDPKQMRIGTSEHMLALSHTLARAVTVGTRRSALSSFMDHVELPRTLPTSVVSWTRRTYSIIRVYSVYQV